MKNRTPVPRQDRPPLPGFDPVPRKSARHDGWTPDRQKAFIEALADTGSVSRAAAMVNMSAEGAYYLRRQPGADGFRRAWEAALDYGVARMKDIAFERAVEGYLVPCFVGGKLIGWRRKYNDRLLMFCLRHYGEDASGKRTKIEYFSTRASAAAGSDSGHSGAASEASTTTVRTVMSGKTDPAGLDHSVALIDGFQGIDLDDTAREEILAVLRDCAERRRFVAGTPDDPDELFIAAEQPERDMLVYDPGYTHPRKERRRPPPAHDVVAAPEAMLDPGPKLLIQGEDQFRSSPAEMSWEMLDDEEGMQAIERATESVKRARLDREEK